MSDQTILKFQFSLYKKISECAKLNNKNIFNYIPKKSDFPFIYIGNYKISDWSNKTMIGFKIIFSIMIFSRVQTNHEINILSDLIINLLDDQKMNLGKNYLANIKLLSNKIEYISQRSIFRNTLFFQSNIEEL